MKNTSTNVEVCDDLSNVKLAVESEEGGGRKDGVSIALRRCLVQ